MTRIQKKLVLKNLSKILKNFETLVEMLRANQHYSDKVELSDLYEVYLKPVEMAILTGDIKAKQ